MPVPSQQHNYGHDESRFVIFRKGRNFAVLAIADTLPKVLQKGVQAAPPAIRTIPSFSNVAVVMDIQYVVGRCTCRLLFFFGFRRIFNRSSN